MISDADFPDVFPWMRERKPCSKDVKVEVFSGEGPESCSGLSSLASLTETEARRKQVLGKPSHVATSAWGARAATMKLLQH